MDGSLATYTAVPPQFAASSTTGEDFSADQDLFLDYVGFDPDKAAAFFEAAKAELNQDEFSFTLIYGNNEGDEVAKVAQAIKEDLEDLLPGLEINLQPMTKAERLDKMVKYISDRIGVLHLGHMVESGTKEEIFSHPIHPYTKSLLSAIPYPNPEVEKRRHSLSYNYASSGINYSKGTEHRVEGTHTVLATEA